MGLASSLLSKLPGQSESKKISQDLDQRIKFFQQSYTSFSRVTSSSSNQDLLKSNLLYLATDLYKNMKLQMKSIINVYIDYHVFIGKIVNAIYQCMSAIDLIINKTKTDSFEAIKRRVSDLMIYITQVITTLTRFQKSIAAQ